MAQETKVEEKTCLIPAFERNRYFFGKPMTVRDFEAEQQYIIGKSRLQNRLIHGSGIICGMAPSEAKITGAKFTIYLTEGAALDCCGNLIVVNKSDTVEVQAQGTPAGGPHYLYVRFSECVRQPIMASANVSSCEEVCCYNRIRETFEVFLSDEAPVAAKPAFTGTVKTNKGQAIVGARVKALQQKGENDRLPGAVQAETLADAGGKFSLEVPGAGIAFDVVASATGFSASTISGATVPLNQKEKKLDDFVLTAQSAVAPADVCNEVTQDYFDGHSNNCLRCDDPKVFLAIANINGGLVTIDTTSSDARRDRSVVYTNPMLHDLLCDHISDFNNPHRTSAAQVKALQNVNGVGNSDDKAEVVSRIDIVSDGTIKIEPEASGASVNKITIKGPAAATLLPKAVSGSPLVGKAVASFALEDHVHTLEDKVVARKHLSEDVFGKLVFSSDSSVKVVTKNPVTGIDDRQIDITTKLPSPSDQTPSKVTLNPSKGQSADYARGDHAHTLEDKVVARKHLSDDVFGKLVFSSDSSIKVVTKPGTGIDDRQIDVTTKLPPSPSNEMPSKVTLNPSKGQSADYARGDHVHTLQLNEPSGLVIDVNGLRIDGLVGGKTNFVNPVAGPDPNLAEHFATKRYVDKQIVPPPPVIAGKGLVSADHTISVGEGDGILVGEDSVAVRFSDLIPRPDTDRGSTGKEPLVSRVDHAHPLPTITTGATSGVFIFTPPSPNKRFTAASASINPQLGEGAISVQLAFVDPNAGETYYCDASNLSSMAKAEGFPDLLQFALASKIKLGAPTTFQILVDILPRDGRPLPPNFQVRWFAYLPRFVTPP